MWRTNVVLQILHSASGCVQDDKRQASFRMGQQTANKPHLYLVKRQVATKYRCSQSLPVQGINPSETTKLRTHTFHSDPESPE